jgi:hypothetical protein
VGWRYDISTRGIRRTARTAGGHSTERSLRRTDFVLLGGMAALEKCYEIRLDWLPRIAMEGAYGGLLEEIRQDPRFTALMEKLDIPSAPDA